MPAVDERPNRDLKQRTKKRVPLGVARQKLVLNQLNDPAHHYHWINDVGTMIADALSGGYEFVSADTAGEVGVRDVVASNHSEGSGVCKVVERGTGAKAFLMRIPIELYNEDRAEQARVMDAKERPIREGHIKGLDKSRTRPGTNKIVADNEEG